MFFRTIKSYLKVKSRTLKSIVVLTVHNKIFQVREVGKKLGIVPTIIRDQELEARGFGGIYGVGKGALHPPALAVLSHCPQGATKNIAWVGKGIVYDTGGLSIKVIYELRYIK